MIAANPVWIASIIIMIGIFLKNKSCIENNKNYEFENEKEALKHILSEWFINNNDYDVLGCEPGCRNDDSPGCDWCIRDFFEHELNKNQLKFQFLGGEDWILEHTVHKPII